MRQAGLPPPQGNDVFTTDEGARHLLFLPRFGMVIAFQRTPEKDGPTPLQHPLIAEPIAEIRSGDYVARLIPGRRQISTIGEADAFAGRTTRETDFGNRRAHALTQTFHDNDMYADDAVLRNIGLLPVQTTRYPRGIPEIIDEGAVKKKPPERRKKDGYLQRLEEKGYLRVKAEDLPDDYSFAKDHINQMLSQRFEDAWPQEARQGLREGPDVMRMRRFWKMCESMTQSLAADVPPEMEGSLSMQRLPPQLCLDVSLLPDEGRNYACKLTDWPLAFSAAEALTPPARQSRLPPAPRTSRA